MTGFEKMAWRRFRDIRLQQFDSNLCGTDAWELQIPGPGGSHGHIRARAEHGSFRDAAFILQESVQYADITVQLR